MTTPQISSDSPILSLPARWQDELSRQVAAGENVLSAFEVDLDHQLRFVKSLIVVTDQAILSRTAGESEWKTGHTAKICDSRTMIMLASVSPTAHREAETAKAHRG